MKARSNLLRRSSSFVVVAALAAAAILAGIEIFGGGQETIAAPPANEPASVEQLEGSVVSRLTLAQKAFQRLGIRTTPLRRAPGGGETGRTLVPYSALIYEPDGETWVYTSPSKLVFVRAKVTVDRIEGDRALLASGPPIGTSVVTVGAAELYGTEFGVGK